MWINHDDYIEAIERNSGPLNRIAEFQETISAKLKAIKEGQDSLRDFVHTQVSHSQHSIEDFQDKYHTEVSSALVALAERLANIEVAFTVRLEALERKIDSWSHDPQPLLCGKCAHSFDECRCRVFVARRPNGKHPAGKRK